MGKAAKQDEWNIKIKVNPTWVQDVLEHPVYALSRIKIVALGLNADYKFGKKAKRGLSEYYGVPISC